MKSTTELTPCPQILPAIERIVRGEEKGGIFMWYVRKHIEKCGHCQHTLEALRCYQDAVQQAFHDAKAEGEKGVTEDDLHEILRNLE
jgi:hypothetical protein